VVLNTKSGANEPPQSQNVNKITNVLPRNQEIEDAELFGRNIAALGQCQYNNHFLNIVPYLKKDFDLTSTIFRITATNVQNLLASVTPPSPIAGSLVGDYYSWLRGVVSGYPSGCT
jgi:hypothetical protein